MSEKRYHAKLSLSVTDSDGNPVTSADLSWSNLKYEGLVLLETVQIEALDKMNEVGMAQAKAMGQGEFFDELKHKK